MWIFSSNRHVHEIKHMSDFKYMCRFYHKAVFTIHHNKNINNYNNNYIQYQLIKSKYFVLLLYVSGLTYVLLLFETIPSKNWSSYKKLINLVLILLDAFLHLRIWSTKFETSTAHVQVVILNITYHNRVITCKSSYATSSNKIVYFILPLFRVWWPFEWKLSDKIVACLLEWN